MQTVAQHPALRDAVAAASLAGRLLVALAGLFLAIALQARDGAIEDELMHALERWEQLGSA